MTDKLDTVTELSLYDIDQSTLDNLITQLSDIKTAAHDKRFRDMFIDIIYDDAANYPRFFIMGYRPETEKEKNLRIRQQQKRNEEEKKRKEFVKKDQYKDYLKLKKKFEGKEPPK